MMPLSDISITYKEVKVVLKMPGINKKEDIKISVYEKMVEMNTAAADISERNCRKILDLPKEADIQTAKVYLQQ
jgi:HSP20 family molecular chaperone IbpA